MRERTFAEALEHRRSYYSIGNDSPVQDEEIVHIIRTAVKHVPSAFNSQTTRVVLLLNDEHRKLWTIVKDRLRDLLSEDRFSQSEQKIDCSFSSGYGTILFFEEHSIVEELQKTYPTYHENFPTWSQHTSAMHQLAIWTMLEDKGFGASLQHYNPLIDEDVRLTWQLPETWQLVAQMPFGIPTADPGVKEYNDLSERIKIFI